MRMAKATIWASHARALCKEDARSLTDLGMTVAATRRSLSEARVLKEFNCESLCKIIICYSKYCWIRFKHAQKACIEQKNKLFVKNDLKAHLLRTAGHRQLWFRHLRFLLEQHHLAGNSKADNGTVWYQKKRLTVTCLRVRSLFLEVFGMFEKGLVLRVGWRLPIHLLAAVFILQCAKIDGIQSTSLPQGPWSAGTMNFWLVSCMIFFYMKTLKKKHLTSFNNQHIFFNNQHIYWKMYGLLSAQTQRCTLASGRFSRWLNDINKGLRPTKLCHWSPTRVASAVNSFFLEHAKRSQKLQNKSPMFQFWYCFFLANRCK